MKEIQFPEATHKIISPGRVNLLGEHVDYNGGVVLPAAIDRAVYLHARKRHDELIHIVALDLEQEISLSIQNLKEKKDSEGIPLPHWAIYPAGVAFTFRKHGFSIPGVDVVYTSNIPIGAGLSSSAAVEVGFAVLWQALGGWEMNRLKLSQYCQEAENAYVGVNCGLMDQFACANGVDGHVLFFDTRDLTSRPIPLPNGTAVIIADSGVRRSLAESAYNDRRAACEEALAILRSFLPEIRHLRDVTPEQFNLYANELPEIPRKRARHVVSECARVEKAPNLLFAQDSAGFGKLMLECHASLRDDFEVSCPELNTLVKIAINLSGCWGARLTGAGFGGCTVNLVDESYANQFIQSLKDAYSAYSGKDTEVYLCHASQGARIE